MQGRRNGRSDEERFITQNTFITEEVTESDVILEGGSDIEARFNRWLCDAEIQERVRKSVPLATRYKDGCGWAVKTFETGRLTREKIAVSDKKNPLF